MNINTKLDLRQSSWRMKDNKPIEAVIDSIRIKYISKEYSKDFDKAIVYGFRILCPLTKQFKEWEYANEKEVFASKKELLDSL